MSEIIEWVLEMDVRDGQGDNVQPLLEEMGSNLLITQWESTPILG